MGAAGLGSEDENDPPLHNGQKRSFQKDAGNSRG